MKLSALIPELHAVSREMAAAEREARHQSVIAGRIRKDLERNVQRSFADILMEELWKRVPCNVCTHSTVCRVAGHGGTITVAAAYCKVKSNE